MPPDPPEHQSHEGHSGGVQGPSAQQTSVFCGKELQVPPGSSPPAAPLHAWAGPQSGHSLARPSEGGQTVTGGPDRQESAGACDGAEAW